jgi:hypothetical protein
VEDWWWFAAAAAAAAAVVVVVVVVVVAAPAAGVSTAISVAAPMASRQLLEQAVHHPAAENRPAAAG